MTVAERHVTGRSPLGGAGTAIEREGSGGCCDGSVRNLLGDDIDQPANGIRAIEERRRTADHFDPRGRGGIHVDAVVARLAREIAHPQAVFNDQHAIAVKTPDDRTRRSRPEAADGDPRLGLQGGANGALQFLRQFLTTQDVRGLERLELVPSFWTDRRHLGEMQLRIDPDVGGEGRLLDRDLGPGRQEPVGPYNEMIGTGRDVLDRELAIGPGAHLFRVCRRLDHDDALGTVSPVRLLVIVPATVLACRASAGAIRRGIRRRNTTHGTLILIKAPRASKVWRYRTGASNGIADMRARRLVLVLFGHRRRHGPSNSHEWVDAGDEWPRRQHEWDGTRRCPAAPCSRRSKGDDGPSAAVDGQ